MKRIFQSLSTTNDGAFIIDGNHRVIFWNQAAEEILGYTAEEVAGRQCYELLGGRDEQGRTLCQRYCLVAIQAERGDLLPSRDVYARTKTGKRRWLNVTTFVYPVHDETIRQVIVHLFRDATEEKNQKRFIDSVLAASEKLQQNGAYHLNLAPAKDSQLDSLTERERQVLEQLVQGLSTDEMASRLFISPATVRNHVQNILEKWGVHSRLEAIAYAYQHGMMIESNGL